MKGFIEDNKEEMEKLDLHLLLEKNKISEITYNRVLIGKKYIERKYNKILIKHLENELIKEKLLKSKIPEFEKEEIVSNIRLSERKILRKNLEKLTIYDYKEIKLIGKGCFGEVYLAQNIKTKEIVAIKKLKKELIIRENQVLRINNEQDFLSKINSQWIIKIKSAFQEGNYIYLIMEYLSGGDLMKLLIKENNFKEKDAKFYICEIILAIESLHQLGCIHRDIKPDNILIDKNGHLKLTDFGLAKIADNIFKEDIINHKGNYNIHEKNYSFVGTCLYIAPEILKKIGYYKDIDWWSLGVIFYEMLVGYSPFKGKNKIEVYKKVLDYNKFISFPDNLNISNEAKDLIFKLLTKSENRLGKNGSEEIKSHPFFKGINWKKIREMRPPFIPNLKNDYDVKYFEKFEEIEPFYPVNQFRKRKDAEFIGYTYKGEEQDPTDLISIIEMIQKKQVEYLESHDQEKQISNAFDDNHCNNSINDNDIEKKNHSQISNGMKEDDIKIKSNGNENNNNNKFINLRNRNKSKEDDNCNNGKLIVIPLPKNRILNTITNKNNIDIKENESKSPYQKKNENEKNKIKNSISAKIMRIFSRSKSRSKNSSKEKNN